MGSIVNTKTITAGTNGILLSNVAFFGTPSVGGITNSGTISAGEVGIVVVNGGTFFGGISNSGTISAGLGIVVSSIAQFGNNSTFGGITNSGTIITNTSGVGISVTNVGTFMGGIVNSGKILGGSSGAGIVVNGIATFIGGISNSGLISAGNGIVVASVAQFGNNSTFGGITNSGKILVGPSGAGIDVIGVGTFMGGITNSGTISAGSLGVGIALAASTFVGNVSNSGMILGGHTGIFICSCVTFGGGAIINSGTISGAATAIDASIASTPITIDQVGGLISGAIMLSTNGDTLNISGGTITGNIVGQGNGTINFALGSGTFIYGSAFNFSNIGQVTVNSGTIILDSTANSATNVTVNGGVLQVGDSADPGAILTVTAVDVLGGTLAGHGTIAGAVSVGNGGTLMPGGSIGTLTINGNLTFSSGAFYAIEVAPPLSSNTQVNGTATLGNATVEVLPTPGFGNFAAHTYTILTATNPLSGTFNPTVALTQGLLPSSETAAYSGTATLSYDANDVFLSVPAFTVTLTLPSNAPANAQNVANVINSVIIDGGALPAGFNNLANLSGTALNNAANQLGGQGQGSFVLGGFQASDLFLTLLTNPYIQGRGTSFGQPLAYAAETPIGQVSGNAFSALALGPRGTVEPRLSLWGATYGGNGTIQGNAVTGAAAATRQIYGAATGLDYANSPNTLVGFALGGGGTSWNLDQGLGGGHSGMFHAGVYELSRFGPAYVSGALAYALHDVTTNRTVTLAGFDALQGDFAANVYSGRLETGYRLPYGVVAFTPYGAAQTQTMFLPSYSEFATNGASTQFALSYTSHTYNATRTELGTWIDSDYFMSKGIKLYGKVAWAHDFDNEGQSTAFFQSLPGGNFVINTAKPARDGALTTLGVEYKLADGWSLQGKFDSEFSSTTAIFSGTAAIRKVW